MDRSTRNLFIIILLVVVMFLALNYVASSAPLGDWAPVLVLLLVALAIWGYDRLSSRGVDDSGAADTGIDPITYERPILAAEVLGAMYQQAEPNPDLPAAPPEPMRSAPAPVADVLVSAPPAATVSAPQPAPVSETQPPPQPRLDLASSAAPAAAVENSASAAQGDAPSVGAKAEEKPETPPTALDVEGHPPADAPETTTIEEKSAPPPSAAAPETDPEQAEHTPDGTWQPGTPKDEPEGRPETLSKPTEGVAPEPPSQFTEPKTAKQGKAKAKQPEVEVSATPLANDAPVSTLPINADPAKPDDLKVIEGIGPKMEKALHAAGITTFAQLAGASEVQLNAAILAAGMRFAPTVPTWAEQASYAANGDFVGLETFQKTLVGGRKTK